MRTAWEADQKSKLQDRLWKFNHLKYKVFFHAGAGGGGINTTGVD